MATSTIKDNRETVTRWTGDNNAVEVKRVGKVVFLRMNYLIDNPVTVQSTGMNEILTLPSNYRPNNIVYFLGFNNKMTSNYIVRLQVETNGKVSFEVDTTAMPIGTQITLKATATYILN